MRGMLERIWALLRGHVPGPEHKAHQSALAGAGTDGGQGEVNQTVKDGAGNVQVGVAYGDVISNVSHLTHHSNYFNFIHPQSKQTEPTRKPSSSEQSAVLRRLDQLRDRVSVLDFMDRQFGTRMVIHLTSEQLYRLNRYLDVVLRDPKSRKPTKSPSETA